MTNQHELDMLRDQAIYLDQTLEKARELETALGNIGKAVRSLGLTELNGNLEHSVEIAGSLSGKLDDIRDYNRHVPSSEELEECAEAATRLCKALESANAEAKKLPALDN